MLALVALAAVLAVAVVLLMAAELRSEETGGDPRAERGEDRPVSIPMTPELTEYGRQRRERAARICAWLGMSPDRVFRCDDGDPDRYGRVEIHWQSTERETPTRGVVTWTGATGTYGEPAIHAGRLTLDREEAAELAEVAGPKPDLLTAEQRGQLARLALEAHRTADDRD